MIPRRLRLPFTLSLTLASSLIVHGYDQLPPPAKVILPAPRSAAESLAAITVAPDLRVELVASEPMVMDPISVAWGADGRMWVVEMADYPLGLDGRGKPGGRIKVLESTRGDGTYDKVTLFAEGLNFPSSVLPWRNGALVTAAPDILYLEDTNGDGKADKREKWFTGLGEGNQQHRANGLVWGLDGWLYLSNGDSGGLLKSRVSGQVLDLGRRDLRIEAEAGLMEPLYGRSQYGRNRDDWGNWFGGNNSNPAWHYALDDHYLRRNSVLAPPNASIPVPKIPGQAPVFPTSQTLARFNDPFGKNRFTSACSTMIYRDDLLGAVYAGNLFVCEPVHNLVNRQVVTASGVTFSSDRAPTEQNSEVFSSSDNWSRFTNARTGPDGALYIVDMYRIVIEHPQWIPDAWMKELGDLRAGHDKGRIYRLLPKQGSPRAIPRLDRADEAGLVAALRSPNGTVRDLAQQQLVWRKATGAKSALERLAAEDPSAAVRVQALWTLSTLGMLQPATVARALQDRDAHVRRHAVQLSDRFAGSAPELLPTVVALTSDADAAVRQQVGYSLGEWTAPEAGTALAALVRRESDPLIVAAAMSSARPHAGVMIARMNAEGGTDRTLLELVLATRNVPALASFLTRLAPAGTAAPTAQFTALGDLLAVLRRTGGSLAKLRSEADDTLRPALDGTLPLFTAARKLAADRNTPVESRTAALSILGQGVDQQDDDAALLTRLLHSGESTAVKVAAATALGQMSQATVPFLLLSVWEQNESAVRSAVLDAISGRPAWIMVLFERAAARPAMLEQIDAGHRAALLNHGDGRVAARAAELFQSGANPDRQKLIDRYLEELTTRAGDATRGRAVFTNTCAACHQLGEAGGRAIGPDLAGLADRSAAYLVPHILDPNRAIEDKYMLYTVTTNDGRTLGGLLAAEAGNSLTLLGIDGAEQVILRNGVKSVASLRRSLMPEGLEATLTPQAMADLVAFIGRRGETSAPVERR
jgi:putative membrane-bound dehydrogenase-like protein